MQWTGRWGKVGSRSTILPSLVHLPPPLLFNMSFLHFCLCSFFFLVFCPLFLFVFWGLLTGKLNAAWGWVCIHWVSLGLGYVPFLGRTKQKDLDGTAACSPVRVGCSDSLQPYFPPLDFWVFGLTLLPFPTITQFISISVAPRGLHKDHAIVLHRLRQSMPQRAYFLI